MIRKTHAQQGCQVRPAIITWAGVYPVLTLIALVVQPALSAQAISIRILIINFIMAPVFAVMPTATRMFGRWISGSTG